MKLLALDCATEACSVALYENPNESPGIEGRVIAERHELAARAHTQKLLPMVEAVLEESGFDLPQLDAIAYGRGPGSFTGLRIALGAVQGLAYGANLPVLPVSSLAALAQTALDEGLVVGSAQIRILAAIDARMDEIYWSTYTVHDGLVRSDQSECLTAPEGMGGAGFEGVGVGSGLGYANRTTLGEKLQAAYVECVPRATAIARLAELDWQQGRTRVCEQALPVYLRDEVAWQKSS